MLLAMLLLAACPKLPAVPERAALKRAVDVAPKLCAGGATRKRESHSKDGDSTRVRRVTVRTAGAVREITFRDEHHSIGLGDASGSASETVVFLEVDGVVRAVETSVEERSETGPFLYDRLSCVMGEQGPACLATTNRARPGEPGPEQTSCGAEAVKKLPTLAGVQKRYELCPELLPH